MASTNSDVSYYQVYRRWLNVDHRRNEESTIPVDNILSKLLIRKVVGKSEYQRLNSENTDEGKSKKLFLEIMPAKGEEGFDDLMTILLENSYSVLARTLNAEREKSLTDVSTAVQNPLTKIQTHLSCLLKKNFDFMAKYWSRDIPIAQTEAAFVQVQVFEHFKSENGNPVNSYSEVFHKAENEIHPRIMIQADPGCGKTTYVNKLALDWANEDDYLRKKFDFVFLIALQTLTMDVFDAIKCFLPKLLQSFFSSYAENADSKILLILDGFDEIIDSSQCYLSVMKILNGQSMQFQFFHIIVTTRRSHIDKIPQQFHQRSLLIKGFDEESMKQFLIKQNVPLPTVDEESKLNHLLQTPLFCTIYCSLHFGGGDSIELEDSYDLIKAMITNTLQKKAVANVEEQLEEIGKFAFQLLDSDSLNFLKKFYRSSEVNKPSFDLSRVNLDLLIKRRIPTRGVGNFKEEFSLPHQLIAEYLAGRYFVRSLTAEQLKHADISDLIHAFDYVTDLPFVRFFLFELLFSYLEKKYEESVFDKFLNIPELRFIWNCKSNTDILTLDNVSELNFYGWTGELVNHSRLIPTLSKCRHLSSLSLSSCWLSKSQMEQLVNFINNNCFQKLIELDLSWNRNVGSTPQLFTSLRKCKHLRVLNLDECKLTVESTTELAKCIDNNGLANLRQLNLPCNENIGSSHLFHVLYKCPQLEELDLSYYSMTRESLNTFQPKFVHRNTMQSSTLVNIFSANIWIEGNEMIKVDDNFFIALEKCPKISILRLSQSMESVLSEVGRKAKETLKQRGCQFLFD